MEIQSGLEKDASFCHYPTVEYLNALNFWIITWDLHSPEDYQSLYEAEFGFQFDMGNLYRLHGRKADTVYHASQHFYFQIQCSILISTPFNWVKFFFFLPIKLS